MGFGRSGGVALSRRSHGKKGGCGGEKVGYGRQNIEALRRDLLDLVPSGSFLKGDISRQFTNKQKLDVESICKRLVASGKVVGDDLRARMEDYNKHC